MAVLKQLVNTKELNIDHLVSLASGKVSPVYVRYDDCLDTFFIMFSSLDTESVVHYIDEFVALLYTPDRKEVVGIQVDDFKEFAKKNRTVAKAWNVKVDCGHFVDLGDLYSVKDKKERVIVQEVAKVAESSFHYDDRVLVHA